MTTKTKAKATPPDAIPKRWKQNLIPAAAVGVPGPVAEANERLRVAGLAEEAAFRRRRELEQAARVAPKRDSDAGIDAVERGEDPPPATAAKLEAEAEAARRAEFAAKRVSRRAAVRLELAIREHRDGWIAAQREDAEACAREALDAIDALHEALDRLGDSAGVLAVIQRTSTDKTIDHGRHFKARTVGVDLRDGRKNHPVGRTLAELRDQIEVVVPAPLPTADELAAREAAREPQRQWARMARGGVFVGGGD